MFVCLVIMSFECIISYENWFPEPIGRGPLTPEGDIIGSARNTQYDQRRI